MDLHRLAEERSLAYHRRVAQLLGERPELLETARRRARALEHVIRAAAAITNEDEIVIVGSQSVLGQFPDAPAELLRSMEADVYPRKFPERWDLIDGSIGEGSPFHTTFGYYAQGVGPETAVLPSGGEARAIRVAAMVRSDAARAGTADPAHTGRSRR